MRKGDLIGFETSGTFAALIRTKQRMIAAGGFLRWVGVYVQAIGRLRRPSWPWWVRVTHIAIVSSEPYEADGASSVFVIQAVAKVDEVQLSDYGTTPHHVLPLAVPSDRAQLAVSWAARRIGVTYGFVTIASFVLNTFTPKRLRIDFTKAGSFVCSGLGANAWEQAGVDFGVDVDPNQLTPGELARDYGKEAS